MTDLDIDYIVKNNKIYRFTLELQNTKDPKRKSDLNAIIDYLNGIKKTEDDAKTLLDEMYKDLADCSMKKKWARLQPIQKITKIKEYLLETIKDKKEYKKIEDIAIKMINDGKLKTAKEVNYDITTSKILEIMAIKDKINKAKMLNNDDEDNNSSSDESD
jgi:hypothetical protein